MEKSQQNINEFNKMKILTIIANPLGWLNPNMPGGGEITTTNSLEEWNRNGVGIITIEPESCSVSRRLNKSYKTVLVRLIKKKNNSLTSMLIYPFWIIGTIIAAKREKFDLVYSPTSNITDLLPAFVISKMLKKPIVSSLKISIYDEGKKKIFSKIREDGSSILSSILRTI